MLTKLPDFERNCFAYICWSLWDHRNSVLHAFRLEDANGFLDNISTLHVKLIEANTHIYGVASS